MTQEAARKHWKEIRRWAESPEGTQLLCGCEDMGRGWVLTSVANFREEAIYIVDDEWARLRKAQADGKQLQYKDEYGNWVDRELTESLTKETCLRSWRILHARNFPVYRRSKNNGIIVRFTYRYEGEVLMSDDPRQPIGDISTLWADCDDESVWEKIPTATIDGVTYYDTQPVWVWDRGDVGRALRFINAANPHGEWGLGRNGYTWDYYAPVKHIEGWMIEAWKELRL